MKRLYFVASFLIALMIGGFNAATEKGKAFHVLLGSSERVFDDLPSITSVDADFSKDNSLFYFLDYSGWPTVYKRGERSYEPVFVSFGGRPDTIRVGPQDNFYIADSSTGSVEIVSPSGQSLASFRVPQFHSLAVLKDGNLVIASPLAGKVLHIYDRAGRRLSSFGEVRRFDKSDKSQNRFLNAGMVVIDSSDTIYYIDKYSLTPTVRRFTKYGKLINEFAIEGEAIDIQAQTMRRFLDIRHPGQIGGIAIINSAVIDPVTGHLWVCMNGSSETAIVYEYNPGGRKVREYSFKLTGASVYPMMLSGINFISVNSPSIYVFTSYGAYRFEQNETLPLSEYRSILAPCGSPQTWGECKTDCNTPIDFQDDKNCKASLQASINPNHIVIASNCSNSSSLCSASVTTCDPANGFTSSHTITLYCTPPGPGGGGGGGGGGLPCDAFMICEVGGVNERCLCDSLDSPIVIDIEGDGIELTDAYNGVGFDLNSNGTQESLAWTECGSDDAWLVLDRNNNGLIDNGREMFGNYTAQPPSTEPNGFLALAEFDKQSNGGNSDGKIDSRDSIFSSLRLWQDINHNGLSEPDEMKPLPALNLMSLDLDYKEKKQEDEHGNHFKYRAKVYDSQGAHLGRWAWDVFLTVRPIG